MEIDALLRHENAERILREGWELFQRKGFRGVSMNELCQRCGVTKPTVYYYFHDKENLFVQVVQFKLRGLRQSIEQPGALSTRLQRITATILEGFEANYNVLLHDRTHIKNPANRQRMRDAFYHELQGPLMALMQSGIAQGELAGDTPECLAMVFLGIVGSFIGRSGELGMDSAQLAQHLAEHFLRGASHRG
jgi:AcrR family transcriptional regulator